LVTKEIDTLREELTGAIDFLKLRGQKVAGLEKRVNNLVEAKELPDIQELKHYQVCHFFISYNMEDPTFFKANSWHLLATYYFIGNYNRS